MARRTAAQLAQTRESLIASAEDLFAERGFVNTQIAEIADHAGVGISSFYRQFPDKNALLTVVVQGLFEDLRRQLIEAREHIDSTTPLDQLMAIRRTYDIVFGAMAERPKVALTMLRSGYGVTLSVEELVWDSLTALADDLAADLQRAQDADLLHIERKRDFADALIGMVIQLSHRMLVDGAPSPAEAAQLCTRMTVGAMAAYMPAERIESMAPLLKGLGW